MTRKDFSDLPDRDQREAAIHDLDRSLAIEASAGTGKTSLIVERALNLVLTGRARIQEMAVITFTEKAASELEERIRARLEEASLELEEAGDPRRPRGGLSGTKAGPAAVTGEGSPSLDDPDAADRTEQRARVRAAQRDIGQAPIQTIHAFASLLLRLRPVEAGIDPQFTVTDREGQRALFEEAWDTYLAGEATKQTPSLHRLLKAGVRTAELRTLAARFVENRDVVGSPGAQLARTPRPDATAHLESLRAWFVETVRDLRGRCRDGSDKILVHFERVESWIATMEGLSAPVREVEMLTQVPVRKGKVGTKPAWGAEIDRARGVLADLNTRVTSYQEAFGAHLAGEAFVWLTGFLDGYRDLKKAKGVLDFHDLLSHACALLAQPRIAEQLRAIFPRILVDEFQDTDPLQMELVASMTGAGEEADWRRRTPIPGALFIVGDPKQSIYRFRRADLALYARTQQWLALRGGADSAFAITANFRCRPGLASWVNALFERTFVVPEGEDRTSGYAPLHARRPAGDFDPVVYLVPEAGAPPSSDRSDWRGVEAAAIARTLRAGITSGAWSVEDGPDGSVRPARYGDIAMLFRSFTDVSLYEEALRDEGIDSLTSGGKEYFARREVAAFASLLRAIESPRDPLALLSALRSGLFGLTDEAIMNAHLTAGGLEAFPLGSHPTPDGAAPGRGAAGAAASSSPADAALRMILAWHARRNDDAVGRTIDRILEESGAMVLAMLRPGGDRAGLNLVKIAELARRHENEGGTFRSFVRWLGQAGRESFEEGDSPILDGAERAVRILTIHAAKGLEFPIVVIADLGRGQPSGRDAFLIDRAGGRIGFCLNADRVRLSSAGFGRLREQEDHEVRAERKRLLYVAATRARDLLILPVFGSYASRLPENSFLKDLDAGGALPAELITESASGEPSRTVVLPNEARARIETVAGPFDTPHRGAVVPAVGLKGPGRVGGPTPMKEGRAAQASPSPSDAPMRSGSAGSRQERAGMPPPDLPFADAPEEGGRPLADASDGGARPLPDASEGDDERSTADTLHGWQLERDALRKAASGGNAMLAASRCADPEADSPLAAEGQGRAAIYSDLDEADAESSAGASDAESSIGASDTESSAGLSRDVRVHIPSDQPLHPAAAAARARAGERARAFGLAVHAILESVDLSNPEELSALAVAQTSAFGCPQLARKAEVATRRALDMPSVQRARTRRMLRETPVACLEGDVLLEGQIDLAYEEDDGSLVIVDFKTDAVEDAQGARRRAESYRGQMAVYATALERATSRTVRETILLFLAIGVEVPFPHTDEERARVGTLARRARAAG